MSNYAPDPAILTLGGASGAPFYDPVRAAEFPRAILRYRNQRWASRVGLADLTNADWVRHFAHFHPLKDNIEAPLALRYHGHQFRAYNPDIGDGRGFLFAQLRDDRGRLLDLGTKGSGKTPYSRFGDGRLTLKGGVREILATEMLEALGVYTSKSFSLVETGESLHRNDEPSPTRSAVLVRLGHSHIRFGAFQRLAYEEDANAMARLVVYCERHLTGSPSTGADPVLFFKKVVSRTARLVGEWMAAGFVHGVLNTDNMNVTGESFDYGPWRFAPTADPEFTAAYFDQSGLYAFGRQAEAGAWNLARLGGCLTHLVDAEPLNEALKSYTDEYQSGLMDAFFRRLGLKRTGPDDMALVGAFLAFHEARRPPFEQVFFDWFCGADARARAARSPIAELYDEADFAEAKRLMLAAAPERPERLSHAYFEGHRPQTMLIDEVEAIWAKIAEHDDWSGLEAKIAAIGAMREAYDAAPESFRMAN
jgi:uncharacterized protein YdiU (UPF0061 family)